MSTLLKSATIIDASSPFHNQTKDILINNGKIEKIADSIKPESNTEVISLDNLHVSCGWFDTSVSLGEPGFEERETITHGLIVAAKSGFTAIAVNPNTHPVIDSKADVEFLIHKASNSATSLYPIGALTQGSKGVEISEMYDMLQSGAIAFGDYNKPIKNDNLLKIALQYAQNFNGLVLSFPKNTAIAGEGIVNEGVNSTRLGLKGIPALAEHIQIARDLYLLEYTGGKLHIPTISTAKSAELIRNAKSQGLQVTCSVSAHHLSLTDDTLSEFDCNYKVTPPLRIDSDRIALIEAVNDGTIDIITSDHNPIDIENKKLEFSQALDGTIGLESLFGVANKELNTETVINCLTTNPRKVFGLAEVSIKEGNSANLSLFNPNETYTFTKENILSTSKNSAFFNTELKGKVYGIIANNKTVLS